MYNDQREKKEKEKSGTSLDAYEQGNGHRECSMSTRRRLIQPWRRMKVSFSGKRREPEVTHYADKPDSER